MLSPIPRLIIAGGRHYTLTPGDYAWLDTLLPVGEVVSGKCPTGADVGGELWAFRNGILVRPFPANWGKYGGAGGPLRNAQMAEYATHLALFPGNRGTASMLEEADLAGLIVLEAAWRPERPLPLRSK